MHEVTEVWGWKRREEERRWKWRRGRGEEVAQVYDRRGWRAKCVIRHVKTKRNKQYLRYGAYFISFLRVISKCYLLGSESSYIFEETLVLRLTICRLFLC